METWGTASFDNESASEWFYEMEEAHDPGAVMAAALDEALSSAERLGVDTSSQAVAAAELVAACAGHLPPRLPDRVLRWVQAHSHRPASDELADATDAVRRIRAESDLSEFWADGVEDPDENEWLPEIDDLLARLRDCGT
ncbi:MAG: DUF4259 domain-containing protein [Solirubrobacteraceae bacterium]